MYAFEGDTKTITLPAGMLTLDLIDLYSRWKDWLREDGHAGFALAFHAVGGDIPAIPLYLFLLNGWSIVPQAAHHTLTVSAGILEREGGGDPFADPVGEFKIRINRQTPGIAIGYSTTGSNLSAGEIAAVVAPSVWAHVKALTVGKFLGLK